ncbi:MAG: HesA/MoeB/ThiF family protein [Muribaculaceae bacterium]|nr:HesA/MoeB/ThiF family protein [Muribaculaceae bacterium]
MSDCFKKDILNAAKVMVVGCGALGNEVLKNLALMKVGNIVLVDFDNVETDNLKRSILFNEFQDSVGLPKVDVVAYVIRKIHPEINLTVINGDISADVGLGLIKDMDVVIGCVDNRWARYCINRLCMRVGVPWIDGGISELEGIVKIFEPGKNCYACTLSNEEMDNMKRRFSCAGNIRRALKTESAPTTSLIASIIGSIQVQEALKLIHNKYNDNPIFETLSGKMLIYDGKYFSFSTVGISAFDDDCSVHEYWKPVIKSTISSKTTIREALWLTKIQLGAYSVSLNLINDCFVDFICDKETDEKFSVMLPGRFVENFINQSPELSKKPISSYYQNEIRKFHRDSPYLDMTLEEIGIPEHDILFMKCGINGIYRERDYFIEIQ